MSRSGARVAFFVGAIVTAVVPAALISFRGDDAAPRLPAVETTSPLDRPAVNYRGPIRLIKEHGEDHPAPEVFPRAPLEIVTDDCSDMRLFDVDNSAPDFENKMVTLYWSDPGVNSNRSLTILMDSPSCKNHSGARTWM